MYWFSECNKKEFMSLELLNKRINYQGGANQQKRMFEDKLRTLKKALLYSYQAATAVLKDNRQFRCLINPDKNKPDYDNKILSIPYKDICLNTPRVGKTTQGEEEVGIKPGDVFVWKQNNEHWLVFLQSLDEKAYFRSEIRKCEAIANIEKEEYWIYIRGPVETDIKWNSKSGIIWNSLNYSIVFYITANENTNKYFTRFTKIKISDPRDNKMRTWEVAGVNPYYGDGIIQVFANEYFENSIQDEINKEKENEIESPDLKEEPDVYIEGPQEVPQYSSAEYTIRNENGGYWILQETNGEEINLNNTKDIIRLNFTGKIGICTLIYRIQNFKDICLPVKVISL